MSLSTINEHAMTNGMNAPTQAATAPTTAVSRSAEQQRVVVLGGGVAGLTAAYELRGRLDSGISILLIADNDQFTLGPALLDMPFAVKHTSTGFPIAPSLVSRGIEFLHASVEHIDPHRRVVHAGGRDVTYDYLLIATGQTVDPVAVPGVGGEFNASHSIYSEMTAAETAQALEEFIKHPGPAVVGLATGAGYLSAAYECALRLEYRLRRAGVRQRASITFVTPEEYLGHLGVGAPRARRLMERLFARRGIFIVSGMDIARVDPEHVYLRGGRALPSRFSLVIPRFHGASDVWKSEGVTDARGFVPVDAQYRHCSFPEIFAAGEAAQANVPAPPRGGLPKTGYLATATARAAARNLASAITHKAPRGRALPSLLDLRIIDGGDAGMLLLSGTFIRPFRTAVLLPGRSAHRLKKVLTRYVLWKLRTGRTYLP